ncbi:MAG: N-acetyltransferase [Comamonadaceae bacterium]|nr:MAG: N-acetyltransferase [Comamonadaceae bacterium]
MASTEAALHRVETIASFDDACVAMLDRLVVQSGWNQTADDWALFARLGSVHAVRDDSGRIVASGAVLPMDGGGAWISMILVDPARRGGGLGRAVFEHCMRDARRAGRVALLDATPDGERLYARYGFGTLWRSTRWRREARPASAAPLRADAAADLDALAALDAEALGLARAPVLRQLAGREGSCVVRHAQGFAIVRAGRTAHQVGPLIATDEAAAAALIDDIARRIPGPVLVDVPDDRPLLRAQLASTGFGVQRGFARMALGEPVPAGQTAFIHAIAGPEYG